MLIDFDLPNTVPSTDRKPEVVFSPHGRHLKKWIWRHISAVGARISIKFGILMQNNTQITAKLLRSKPEVEFLYGMLAEKFKKNGSNYIATVNWDVSMKFALLIDFDLLKAVTSTNTKPEVVLSGRGRHLEKSICHISAAGGPIWMKFGSLMQNSMPTAVI